MSATAFVSKNWLDFEQKPVTADRAAFELEPEIVEKRKQSVSKKIEDKFYHQCRSFRLPPVHRYYRFAKCIKHPKTGKPRQWAFDFAFVEYRLALECEGLVVRKIGDQFVCTGRHASVSGFREDCVKYQNAALLGWTVVRFELSQMRTGTYAIEMTQRILTAKGWKGANQ